MLPALDRCSVILSRFTGIAKFQSLNASIGFSTQQINLIADTVACLHLVCSKILVQVVEELDLFSAFSAWMRYEIDRLASDTSSTTNEETADKEASIDHGKVLLYLQTCMTSSPLATYFGDEDFSEWFTAKDGLIFHFNDLQTQLQKQEQGLDYKVPLPRVKGLCKYLTWQAGVAFWKIADAEKRNVLFAKPKELPRARKNSPIDITVQDLRFFVVSNSLDR